MTDPHDVQLAVVLLLGSSKWALKDALSRLLDDHPDEVLAALKKAAVAEQEILRNRCS